MKKVRKTKGIVKGAPSGFVISLGIHAAAFFLAGLFVVFTVVNKEEKKFIPPKPVDRPKMKLKKPKVKWRSRVMQARSRPQTMLAKTRPKTTSSQKGNDAIRNIPDCRAW